MTITPLQTSIPTPAQTAETPAQTAAQDETSLKFEQLLWAELLTHTGLEKSLTMGGGDGAAMFSRYFVEAIAADIAKQHPLGLLSDVNPPKPDPTNLDPEAEQ